MSATTRDITKKQIYTQLSTVIDPELGLDIVSMGLIYDVSVSTVQTPQGPEPAAHILMTLTTPGCPLAGVFDPMMRDALRPIEGLDVEEYVQIELTFDPPWIPEMMTEEARAEIGL